ncbi:hypothetical protein AB0B50_20375 [Streptomyces sp. NPDC041068]
MDAVADRFSEEQLGGITLEIALTNFFNQINRINRINRTIREQAGKAW